jgi:hypothetical protein
VPLSVEKEESNDAVTPFNSCALEKSNKLKVKKVLKKEKESKIDVEMIRCKNVNDNVKDRGNHKYDDCNEYNDDNEYSSNRNEDEDEDEDKDEDKYENDGESIKNDRHRSKYKKDNKNGNEYENVKKNENDHEHKSKDKGQDKDKKRKEGTIMEWSAIGSLNWDIMFLLGGGFALSEGFQVR